MTSAQIRKVPYNQAAYIELKRLILDNEVPANSQHLEQELAERLNMSRTPVREALQKLENDGLVEIVPRRGIRILPLSGKDMADIYMILTGLESTAAEQVAKNGLNESEVASLLESVDAMDDALKTGDLNAWASADEHFHKQLVVLTKNARLVSMVDMLWDQAHRARMITLKLRPKPVQSNADHRALVDAIVSGDPETAVRVHRAHREKSGEMLVQLLEDLGLHAL